MTKAQKLGRVACGEGLRVNLGGWVGGWVGACVRVQAQVRVGGQVRVRVRVGGRGPGAPLTAAQYSRILESMRKLEERAWITLTSALEQPCGRRRMREELERGCRRRQCRASRGAGWRAAATYLCLSSR